MSKIKSSNLMYLLKKQYICKFVQLNTYIFEFSIYEINVQRSDFPLCWNCAANPVSSKFLSHLQFFKMID